MRKLLGVFVLLLLGFVQPLSATHFAGGEITYEHTSGNTYEVTLRLYRDCAGINFGSTQSIFLSPTNSGTSLTVVEVSRTDITPLCSNQQSQCFSGSGGSGIQQIVYTANWTFNPLPVGQVYTLSNQSCCRNFAITTLVNGGNTSWSISSQLDPNQSPRNSSPRFLNPPIAFVCVNQQATISPNAFDPDGDALQYSLTACLDQTGNSVVYQTAQGISATNPLLTSSGVSLDPGTGQLTFTPSQVQVGVVCIRVSEFRNGVKIGEVIRDIQIQVQNCNNQAPVITPISNQIAQVGTQLCVPVSITDADGDSIIASTVQPIGGTFTVTSQGPGFLNGTWCWTPGITNQGNTYSITINAQDNACPQPGVAQETFNVTVPIPCNVTLSFQSTRETCAGANDAAINLTVNNATQPISYSWTGPNGFSSFTEDLSGIAPGVYNVIVVDGNNCVAQGMTTVRSIGVAITGSASTTDETCSGNADGSITVNASGGIAPLEYSIDGGNTYQSSNIFSGLSAGSYSIDIRDSQGCTQSLASVSIGSNPNLTVNVSGTNASCNGGSDGSATASPNGGTAPFSYAWSNGQNTATASSLSAGTYTVTVTDANNCSGSASVNIGQATAIIVSANSQNESCAGENDGSAMVSATGGTAPYTFAWSNGSNGQMINSLATGTYSVTVTDANSCTATASVIVSTDPDVIAPTIACPADTVISCEDDNSPAALGTAIASDNCPGVTLSFSDNSMQGSCVNNYEIERTWTATDGAGNTSTCVQMISVLDNTAPQVTCPANITVSNDPGQCGAAVQFAANASDNCSSNPTVSYTVSSGTQFGLGTTTVIATATDECSNNADCSFTVTVNDTEDPVISCPANITVSNDVGQCSAVVSYQVSATDNCPGDSLIQTSGLGSGSSYPIGTTTESYSVSDASGNSATCTFTVTVNDTEDPVISCPANITVSNDAGQCSAVVSYLVSATDNCPGESLTQTTGLGSGSAFPIGTTTESYSVSDASGNSATCSFTVTVNDTEDPVISCPANITVSNDAGQCSAVVSYQVSATDNCPGESLTQTAGLGSGSAFPIGTTTESYTVSDASGNSATCSFTVTVNDTEDPVISCPANITVSNDAGQCSAVVSYQVSASDNCPGESLTQSAGLGSGSTFPIGTTTESYAVSDASGNSATCSFTVTVNDTEDPVISCPANITVSNDPGNCSAVVSYQVNASDNCSGGNQPVSTLQAGDIAFTGYKSDNPDFFSFVLLVDLAPGTQITFTDNGWTNQNTFRANEGELLWEATGGLSAGTEVVITNNNSASAGTIVSTSNGGLLLSTGGDQIFAYQGSQSNPSFIAGINMDGAFTTNATNSSNTALPAQLTLGSSAVEIIPEIDNAVYNCSVTGPDAASVRAAVFNGANWTGNDINISPSTCGFNIGTSSLTITQTAGLGSGVAFPIGTTTETYTATDANGNVVSCSFTVTVEDNEDPLLNCPGSINVNNDPGQCAALVTYQIVSSDNCPGANLTQTAGLGSGVSFPVGVTTESYTITDASGNSVSCSFDVTVNDTEAPVVDCFDAMNNEIVVSSDPGQCSAVVTYQNQASDNCSYTLSYTISSGSTFPVGSTPVFVTATDPSGNSTTCGFTVIVEDNEAPVITCPANVTVSNDAGLCSVVVNYQVNASDNCSSSNQPVSNLQAGDLAFTGYKSDNPDFFSFVLLVDVAPGTQITFTDNGWTNQNSFRANEGELVWEATSGLPAGTEVVISNNNSATAGTIISTFNGGLLLSTNGDQIFAYQGLQSNPTFIAGLNMDGAFTTNATNSSNTALPSQLSLGISALEIVPEIDNAVYNCSVTGPDVVAIRAAVYNAANWTGNDTFISPSTCGFNLGSSSSLTISQTTGLGSGSAFPIGITTETYTVDDGNGNSVSCSFTVTVEDTEAPVITCPANISVSNDPGICGAAVNYSVPFSDNCFGASLNRTAGLGNGATFPIGTTTESYTVTDASGNMASCSFTVTVNDTEAPVALCQNVSVSLDASGNASITTQDVDNGSSDNCGLNLSLDRDNFSCADAGTNVTVTLTATDPSGNTDSCIAQVSVNDTMAPSALCHNFDAYLDPNGLAMVSPQDVDGGSSDNCGISLSISRDLFTCADLGATIPVTLTVTDPSGNTASCVAQVTVLDSTGIVCCPLDLNFELDDHRVPLAAGTQINSQWDDLGIEISADNNNGPDQAILFNSANPTGGDPDLGTPNQANGGPGVGNGGPATNFVAENNILIIAEDLVDANNDQLVDDPDDDANGGSIRFDFTDVAFSIDTLRLVDVDDGTWTITVEFLGGYSTTIPVAPQGDNSVVHVGLNVSNVVALVVETPGSGGIAGFTYCPDGPDVNTCSRALTFEEDHNGNPLQPGERISNQWINDGIRIVADNNNGPDQAILFGSDNPTGGDPDLGTPNSQYGGPGIGNAGQDNRIAEQNVLIIAENNRDNNNDGRVDNPDDDSDGGELLFEFTQKAYTIDSLILIDVDDNDPWIIITEDFGGNLDTITVQPAGDNSKMSIPVGVDSVVSLNVNLPGSGAIARLHYCPEGPEILTPCLGVLDFEQDGLGNPLAEGTFITSQWQDFGVNITADNNNGPDHAIIFNSASPTGGDPDLGTPNSQYGGPGIGNGGGSNNQPEGNLLIIAENIRDNNNDGRVDDPDDDANGGEVHFDFFPTATVDSIVVVDVDDNSGWSAAVCELYNGGSINIAIPNHGDNSRVTVPIMADSVKRLTVRLGGSGGIARVYYCADGPALIAKAGEGAQGASAAATAGEASLEAFPNPFRGESTLRFHLPESGKASLKVYDLNGTEVAELFNGLADGGTSYEAAFRVSGLSSGMYFARLTFGDGETRILKLIVQ